MLRVVNVFKIPVAVSEQCKKAYAFQHRIRSIHTTSRVTAKIFVDKENKFAHNILEKSPRAYQIFHLNRDADGHFLNAKLALPMWLSKTLEVPMEVTGDAMVTRIKEMVQYCHNTQTNTSDSKFDDFIETFCRNSNKLSDDQLLEVLRLVALMPVENSVKEPNFCKLWNTLDIECCRRLDSWRTDHILLVCDAWYQLDLARISDFVDEALRKLGRKVLKMSPEQLVQSMFICNLMRRPIFEMFDFEANLAKCAKDMTLEELGVMAMGFFKTQTQIRNPELIEHMYKRLIKELDIVEDITLVAILKILRYSTKLQQSHLATQLMEALCPQVGRLSLLSCLHCALLGSDMQCCHDGLLELILHRFDIDIDKLRLKDLERICFTIGVFNYHSPSGIDEKLCKKILLSLENRIDEILKYPRCFPTCLHYLTLRGHYNEEMLSAVLDKQYVHHAYGNNILLGREIFHLDSFVKINLKDDNYKGNHLSEKIRATMGKMLTHYIPERNGRFKTSLTDSILLDVKETTSRILRESRFKHVLPHFERPDIVVCYDERERRAIPLSSGCPEDYQGVILTRRELLGDLADSPDIKTAVISVAGWNNVVREKDRFTGLFEMKLNQLKLLGHATIVIYWYEWRACETPLDRQSLLKRRLSSVLRL